MASSSAARLSTGSAPGSPRHTGQTLVFGGAPKLVGQPQKIFVLVPSWTCTSSPITASYLAISPGVAMAARLEDMLHYKNWDRRRVGQLAKAARRLPIGAVRVSSRGESVVNGSVLM